MKEIFGVSTVNDIGSLMMTVVVTAASFKTWLLKNLLLDQLFRGPYFPPVRYREMNAAHDIFRRIKLPRRHAQGASFITTLRSHCVNS